MSNNSSSDAQTTPQAWWDTTGDKDFHFLSFKIGFYMSLQLFLLVKQFGLMKKTWISRVPFFIQLSWSLVNVNWALWQYAEDNSEQQFIYNTVTSIFDITTKVLVLYFLCIRLVVVSYFNSKLVKLFWSFIFVLGIVIVVISNSFAFIPDIRDDIYTILLKTYRFGDFYVSIVEIFTFCQYLSVRYEIEFGDWRKFVNTLKSNHLLESFIVVVILATISMISFILDVVNESVDLDLFANSSFCALKYSFSCDLVVKVFVRTSSKVVKVNTNTSHQVSNGMMPSVRNTVEMNSKSNGQIDKSFSTRPNMV